MTDATAEAAEFELRLPAAYSQGFAHVRIVTVINPDDPGPLGGVDQVRLPVAADLIPDVAAAAPAAVTLE
jgi:hypothetical protein